MSGKQLIQEVCEALVQHGYTVYISKSGTYGMYTDGTRCVSFGGCWAWLVDFSGQYTPSTRHGTGWGIAKDQGVPTAEQAAAWIKQNAPRWAVGDSEVRYTTPEQYLLTYGASSGFTEFELQGTQQE